MISESHPEVRRLLQRMVARVGDRPMLPEDPTPARLRSMDVLLVEPATPGGAVLAQLARAANPSLPIVCESVCVPSRELTQLVGFAAVLVKPFTAEQLEETIERVAPLAVADAA